MKNKTTILMAIVLMVWALSAMSQLVTNAPGAPGPEVTSGDSRIISYLTKYSWVKIFIIPIVTVLVMGLRKGIAIIPVQVWPWVTPFLGAGLDYLGSKIGLWTSSIEAGAIMGGLAVWFHQLGAQTKELKNEGPTPSSGPGSNPVR